ncbi:hypothetical protein PIB30_024698 [Stylosanthes scabra]|uniref:Uncharacterized protein n=1 Tax=Stylosanthes scabra TaxID=79078 RepID=A0ABU6Q9J5_9FABA|nr:hypothetical protein [Stylosanthes scabra]
MVIHGRDTTLPTTVVDSKSNQKLHNSSSTPFLENVFHGYGRTAMEGSSPTMKLGEGDGLMMVGHINPCPPNIILSLGPPISIPVLKTKLYLRLRLEEIEIERLRLRD